MMLKRKTNLVAAGVALAACAAATARGQYGAAPQPVYPSSVYAPPSAPQAAVAAGQPADGNPYWRQGRPRATLLGGPIATPLPTASAMTIAPVAAAPVQPLPMQALPPVGAQAPAAHELAATNVPPTINPPNPVLPNYGSAEPNIAVPPPIAAEPPTAMAALPTAGPSLGAPAAEPAPQPAAELHGLDILRQAGGSLGPATAAAWAEDALRQMQGLRDYTCTFKKREAIDGKLGDQQTMFVKSRPAPLSVYMYFLDQDVRGQEAIYVEGRNNGNIIAHPVGFKQTLVGTLSLAPNDPQAMEGNRHPITSFGIVNLTNRYLQGVRRDMQYDECEVKVIEGARVNDRACTCVQISHPTQRREVPYSMTRLYIDDEYNVPIRYEGYEWPRRAGDAPPLAEEYTYSNLKLNVGLTDADFDPRNPQYGYK